MGSHFEPPTIGELSKHTELAPRVPTSARIPLTNPDEMTSKINKLCDVCGLNGHSESECAEMADDLPSSVEEDYMACIGLPIAPTKSNELQNHRVLRSNSIEMDYEGFSSYKKDAEEAVMQLSAQDSSQMIQEQRVEKPAPEQKKDPTKFVSRINCSEMDPIDRAIQQECALDKMDKTLVELSASAIKASEPGRYRGGQADLNLEAERRQQCHLYPPPGEEPDTSPTRHFPPGAKPRTHVLPYDLDALTSLDVLRESRLLREHRKNAWSRESEGKRRNLFGQVEEQHPRLPSREPLGQRHASQGGVGQAKVASEGAEHSEDETDQLHSLNQKMHMMEMALKQEVDKRLTSDMRLEVVEEDARKEIAAARTVSVIQAQQFENEINALRQARTEEADKLSEGLKETRRVEQALVEELDKVNFELALVHSELRQAHITEEDLSAELERTRAAASTAKGQALQRIEALENDLKHATERLKQSELQHALLQQQFHDESEAQNSSHSQTAKHMSDLFQKLVVADERYEAAEDARLAAENKLALILQERDNIQVSWEEYVELRKRRLESNQEADELQERAEAASCRTQSFQTQAPSTHRSRKERSKSSNCSAYSDEEQDFTKWNLGGFNSAQAQALVAQERKAAAQAEDRVRAAEKQAMYWQILEVDQAKSKAPRHLRKFNLAFRAFVTCACGDPTQSYQIALAVKDMVHDDYTVFVPTGSPEVPEEEEGGAGKATKTSAQKKAEGVASAAVQLASLAYTFVLFICGGGQKVVGLPQSTVAELQAAVAANRLVLIAAEEGVELPLPELSTQDLNASASSASHLTAVLHQSWKCRIVFPAHAPDDAATELCARLGAPDWLLERLPTELTFSDMEKRRRSNAGMEENAVMDCDLISLNWPSLKSVTMSGVVGARAATAFANMLAVNTTITQLSLVGCDMVVAEAVIESLKTNRTLEVVAVGGGIHIPVGGLIENQISTLTMHSVASQGSEGRRFFRQEDVAVLIAALAMNTSLTELTVSGGLLSKYAGAMQLLAAVKNHPRISTLCSVPVKPKDSGELHITELCGAVGPSVLAEHLSTSSLNFSALTLDSGNLEPASVALVAKALQTASHLKLKSLKLINMGMSAEVLYDLLLFREGEKKNLDEGNDFQGPQMACLGALTHMTVDNSPLEDKGAKVLSMFLMSNPSLLGTLNEVHFDSLKIGDNGVKSLVRGLTGGKSGAGVNMLKILSLHSNSFGDAGLTALAAALADGALQAITKLILHSNRSITCNGVKSLAVAFAGHPNLTELDLSMTGVSCQGVGHLAVLLNHPDSKLKVLGLARCAVKEEGARHLATALKPSSRLTELCLARNNIGDRGAFALSEALTANTSLVLLDVSNNNIKSEGVNDFHKILRRGNITLKEFNLTGNQVDKEKIEQVQMLAASKRQVRRSSFTSLKYDGSGPR